MYLLSLGVILLSGQVVQSFIKEHLLIKSHQLLSELFRFLFPSFFSLKALLKEVVVDVHDLGVRVGHLRKEVKKALFINQSTVKE